MCQFISNNKGCQVFYPQFTCNLSICSNIHSIKWPPTFLFFQKVSSCIVNIWKHIAISKIKCYVREFWGVSMGEASTIPTLKICKTNSAWIMEFYPCRHDSSVTVTLDYCPNNFTKLETDQKTIQFPLFFLKGRTMLYFSSMSLC